MVLPRPIRDRLGLEAGDLLTAEVQTDRVVLIPKKKRACRASIVTDPITGLPVLSAGANAPRLTSKQVRESLYEFP